MKLMLLPILAVALIGCSTPEEKRLSRDAKLHRQYASYPTAELQLRRNQIVEMIGAKPQKQIDIKIGSPLAMAMMDDEVRVEELLEEKNSIERELLRRWKGGDREAHLEIFETKL